MALTDSDAGSAGRRASVFATTHWSVVLQAGERESPQAAEALGINLFAAKMKAILLSAAMTSVAGLINAFYYRNLFPTQTFVVRVGYVAERGLDGLSDQGVMQERAINRTALRCNF